MEVSDKELPFLDLPIKRTMKKYVFLSYLVIRIIIRKTKSKTKTKRESTKVQYNLQ